MSTIKNVLYSLLCLVLFLSCGSGLKVTSDYDKTADFKKYKTFNFYHLKTTGNVSQLNADRIVNAIRAEMVKKGYIASESDPDLLVNAVTQLKTKESVTASTSYYGYGGLYRPYGYWGASYMPATTTYNVQQYKDGTFSIDIVDAKSNKMVWEGVGSAEIDGAPADPETAINTGVKKILSGFPPGGKK